MVKIIGYTVIDKNKSFEEHVKNSEYIRVYQAKEYAREEINSLKRLYDKSWRPDFIIIPVKIEADKK